MTKEDIEETLLDLNEAYNWVHLVGSFVTNDDERTLEYAFKIGKKFDLVIETILNAETALGEYCDYLSELGSN